MTKPEKLFHIERKTMKFYSIWLTQLKVQQQKILIIQLFYYKVMKLMVESIK